MSDTTTATTSAPIRAEVSIDPEVTAKLKSYAIDPGDQHIADEIVKFDPVYDTPGNVTTRGPVRPVADFPLSALPPRLAHPIRAQLANEPEPTRAAKERRLVDAAVYDLILDNRVKNGPGPISGGANVYQQEFLAVANDERILGQEFIDLSAKLAEIDYVRHGTDPDTGAKTETIVNKVQGQQRAWMEARLAEVDRSLKAHAIEAKGRLEQALWEAVEARKSLNAMAAEEAEVEAMAKQINRDARIRERATARASFERNRVN